jgi:hypothetical protein
MQGLIFNILFLTCWLHIFFKIIVQHVCFVKGRGMRLRGQKRWNICKLFAIISLPLFPSLRPYVNWERSYATLFIPRVVSPDIYIYIYIYFFFKTCRMQNRFEVRQKNVSCDCTFTEKSVLFTITANTIVNEFYL